MNSTDFLEKQTAYIEEKLSKSDAKWKIVTCHHSVFSPAVGRDFEFARKNWKPLFDKYGVDLVLNGHDHTYARGHVPVKSQDENKSGNFNTLYITSVSGPKQYKIGLEQLEDYKTDGYLSNKLGEQTQFFQVISIENESLIYKMGILRSVKSLTMYSTISLTHFCKSIPTPEQNISSIW